MSIRHHNLDGLLAISQSDKISRSFRSCGAEYDESLGEARKRHG